MTYEQASSGSPVLTAAVVSGDGAEPAEVAVRGEIDLASAGELATVLDEVIDRGHKAVVVDLSEVSFMGTTAVRVIAGAAERLLGSGGSLTIRSPSPIAIRLLDLTGLSGTVALELVPPVSEHLGTEQVARPSGSGSARPSHGLTGHLRKVTAIPADDDVVDGALRLVVALARATVGGADGVSVSLRRRGHLSTVAASDQTISDMDAQQYATGEGPCVDASVNGRWFHAESLEEETRWPSFTPKARELGIRAILSSPLLAADRPVGALNIYSRTSEAFGPKDQELAAVFAGEASVILTDAGVDVTDDELALRVRAALGSRQVIARAEGVIMERDGVDEEAAFSSLRRFSLGTNTALRARAEVVVASTRRASRELEERP